jgi:hypothetical protein
MMERIDPALRDLGIFAEIVAAIEISVRRSVFTPAMIEKVIERIDLRVPNVAVFKKVESFVEFLRDQIPDCRIPDQVRFKLLAKLPNFGVFAARMESLL